MNSSSYFIGRLMVRALLGFTLLLDGSSRLHADEATATYITADQLDSAALLAPPPLPGSAEDAADMAEVIAINKNCTTNEAALAFSEKKFSIFNFAQALPSLQPGKFPKTEAFFSRVQKQAATVTDSAKDYWKRPRPFMVNPALASGKLETSFSYPSGHATEGMVLALVLKDLFPDERDAILAIGRDLGWHRVWIARHYPTDIYAGRVFAQAIVRQMRLSPDFQRDFAEAKEELKTVLQSARSMTPVTQPAVAN